MAVAVAGIRRAGVDCLPPDINASRADFAVEGEAVRYALGALKGVGEKAMEALVAEREANGPFASLDDFAARIDCLARSVFPVNLRPCTDGDNTPASDDD